jgi:hypothetical protein
MEGGTSLSAVVVCLPLSVVECAVEVLAGVGVLFSSASGIDVFGGILSRTCRNDLTQLSAWSSILKVQTLASRL